MPQTSSLRWRIRRDRPRLSTRKPDVFEQRTLLENPTRLDVPGLLNRLAILFTV